MKIIKGINAIFDLAGINIKTPFELDIEDNVLTTRCILIKNDNNEIQEFIANNKTLDLIQNKNIEYNNPDNIGAIDVFKTLLLSCYLYFDIKMPVKYKPLIELNPDNKSEFGKITLQCFRSDMPENYVSALTFYFNIPPITEYLIKALQTPASIGGYKQNIPLYYHLREVLLRCKDLTKSPYARIASFYHDIGKLLDYEKHNYKSAELFEIMYKDCFNAVEMNKITTLLRAHKILEDYMWRIHTLDTNNSNINSLANNKLLDNNNTLINNTGNTNINNTNINNDNNNNNTINNILNNDNNIITELNKILTQIKLYDLPEDIRNIILADTGKDINKEIKFNSLLKLV